MDKRKGKNTTDNKNVKWILENELWLMDNRKHMKNKNDTPRRLMEMNNEKLKIENG